MVFIPIRPRQPGDPPPPPASRVLWSIAAFAIGTFLIAAAAAYLGAGR
jgi:hypothetical protein